MAYGFLQDKTKSSVNARLPPAGIRQAAATPLAGASGDPDLRWHLLGDRRAFTVLYLNFIVWCAETYDFVGQFLNFIGRGGDTGGGVPILRSKMGCRR
jgi:hypothetical protein